MLDLERIVDKLGIEIRFSYLMTEKAGSKKTKYGYLVVINPNLTPDEKMDALDHEIQHIIFGHYDDRKYLTKEEKEAEVEAEWSWPSQRV